MPNLHNTTTRAFFAHMLHVTRKVRFFCTLLFQPILKVVVAVFATTSEILFTTNSKNLILISKIYVILASNSEIT